MKADTPQEIIDYLASKVEEMVNDPTFIEDCANLQFEPFFRAGDDLKEYEEGYYAFLNGMADVILSDHF